MSKEKQANTVNDSKTAITFQSFWHGIKPEVNQKEKTFLSRLLKQKGLNVVKAFYATRLPLPEVTQPREDWQKRNRENEEHMLKTINAVIAYAIEHKVEYVFCHARMGHWAGVDDSTTKTVSQTALTRQMWTILYAHRVHLHIVTARGEFSGDIGVSDWDARYFKRMTSALREHENKKKGQRLAEGRDAIKAKAGKCEGVKGWVDYPERRIEMLKSIRILRKLPKGCTKRRSFSSIADALNDQGKLTFSGKQWTASGVANFYAEWNELSEEKQEFVARRTRALKKARKGEGEAQTIEGEEAYDDPNISDEQIAAMKAQADAEGRDAEEEGHPDGLYTG